MQSPLRKGFTLIELMITVVIIGVLAGIAVPKFNGSRRKAYISAMRSDLRNLVPAQELFYADSARYALDQSHLNVKPSNGMTITLSAGPGYWSATARHEQVTDGFTCAIAVNTQNPLAPAAPDGQSACATVTRMPSAERP
ncbi:MAG: putative pilin [Gemmatimonadetes bacterium]|jgi:prepilin-type N-terminal cleavage/methylation domain-containing protein|nr:putative pilin [Gemmatimonadota bacterium]